MILVKHMVASLYLSKKQLLQSLLDVNSLLQTIVLKVTLRYTITYCNIYIPTSTTAPHLHDIEHIGGHLHEPFVIVGDCNSHNYIWGGNKTDGKNKDIEYCMTKNNI